MPSEKSGKSLSHYESIHSKETNEDQLNNQNIPLVKLQL